MKTLLSAVSITLLASTLAWGDVSLKNGNFFMAYTDVVYSGGLEMKLERVYNSKSSFKGILGTGWGCEFEVFLKTAGDGSVVIYEYGGGAENWFSPPELKSEIMRDSIDKLVRLKYPQSNSESEAYRKKLNDDQVFRGEEWGTAVKNGIIEPRRIAIGTIFTSGKFGNQYLVKTRNGYKRYFDNGKNLKEEFNDIGQLVMTSDRNDNFILYEYDNDGRLVKLIDNYDQTITLSYNGQGLLIGLTDIKGRKAEYRYNPLSELIYSKDVDGNEFRFEYDNRNNLTAIRYSDGSSKEMNYYSKFKHDCIKRVKDRDGTATSYIFDIYNRKHYKVGTVLEGSDGKKLAESSYEYFVEFNAAGGEYTSRMISSLDGDVTDTEYNKSGLPVKITNKGRETRFRYDQMGNPTYKETNSEITELEYQQVINKVSRIRHRDKVRNVTSEVRYDYDNRGNLLSAEGDGKLATFENDRNGNIISIVMNGKIMRLAFNSDSKPVGMELEEESIALTYSENGGANITGKTANSIAVIERYIRDCSKLVNNEHVPNIYNHGEKCTCHRKLLAENVINMLENVLTELGNTNNKTGAPGLMR